ncbi:MAG: winged helix-turn-helix domain-containing protein [Nitrososphaera sp.]
MRYRKYRDRIDRMSQILDAANGGNITKTKIMYKALLSYDQMKEYVAILTEEDLLCYDKDTQTFKTTEKGLRFLVAYNQMDSMIKNTTIALETIRDLHTDPSMR